MLDSLIQIEKFTRWWNGLLDPTTPENDAKVLHWAAETLPLLDDLPYEYHEQEIFAEFKLFLEWLPQQTPEVRAASRPELSEMLLCIQGAIEPIVDEVEQEDAMED